MRLIDADKLLDILDVMIVGHKTASDVFDVVEDMPTVDAEPTEEQVKEYCYKRCLVIVTSELFNEMKARWSAEPVRHGRWKRSQFYKNIIFCDECGEPFELSNSTEHWNYCPNCGAKMDGERREDAETN